MPKRNPTPPHLPDAEEAAVQAQVAADPDNPEITDAQASQLRPFREAMPELYAALKRGRGRPPAAVTKVPVKLRLDSATVETFKASGPGWQTRMNDALAAAAAAMRKSA